MVCVCGHSSIWHEYNKDWTIRNRCRGKDGNKRCNCKAFQINGSGERK